MKLLGEKSLNYPIKDFPGSTVQQIEHKKFRGKMNTFMSISIPLSSFLELHVHFRGFIESHNGFSGPLS